MPPISTSSFSAFVQASFVTPPATLGSPVTHDYHVPEVSFYYHKQVEGYCTILGGRDIVVMVPNEVRTQPNRTFPVIYMLDGDKLFERPYDGTLAPRWKIGKSCRELITAGAMEPVIIVAVFNGDHPEARIADLSPVRITGIPNSGHAGNFVRYIVEQLMPAINSNYPVQTNNVGIIGASLGGLFSAYAKTVYPELITKVGLLSPSFAVDHHDLVVSQLLQLSPSGKIFLVAGASESPAMRFHTQRVYEQLRLRGWQIADSYHKGIDPHGGHNEESWGQQVKLAFQYLFPAQ